MGGDCEGEAQVHTGRVVFDRGVEEPLDLGERYDLVELAVDLSALHAEDGAVEINVLTAGQLQVEAGADLEQAANPAAELNPALGRLGDAREDLEERALACAVAADHADDLARRDLERDIPKRPDHLLRASAAPERCLDGVLDALPQRLVAHQLADAEALGQPADADRRGAHVSAPLPIEGGSNHIGEGPLHAAEIQGARHTEHEGHNRARRKQ